MLAVTSGLLEGPPYGGGGPGDKDVTSREEWPRGAWVGRAEATGKNGEHEINTQTKRKGEQDNHEIGNGGTDTSLNVIVVPMKFFIGPPCVWSVSERVRGSSGGTVLPRAWAHLMF